MVTRLDYMYGVYTGERSSWIHYVRHDGGSTLYISTADHTYAYDAPLGVYNALVNAASVGRF